MVLIEEAALSTTDAMRFETPLYTVAEAARIVDVPPTTLATWAKGYTRSFPGRRDVTGAPVISYVQPANRQQPTIPFVGLAEALVLAAFRRSGVSMQRIRPAVNELEREIGVAHALASRKLYTDGAELMFDFAEQHPGSDAGDSAMDLVVLRNGQRVFADVVSEYLRRIQYAGDGYPELIRVPAYGDADVVVDPRRSFGSPIFERGGSRVDDVLDRFRAGDSIVDLSEEFGAPVAQVEDVLRAASRRAA